MPDKLILFKTDAVVEGVHFTKDTPPEKIGRKALARCLSDIAAMAGTPVAALVTLGLPAAPKRSEGGPENSSRNSSAKIYEGLNALAEKTGVAVVGGETTTNPGGIFISIALLGTVARGKQVLRSGAKTGDAIFVTGELGGSLAGRHLEFEPRLEEARWLAEHFSVHAMIDLSDGLAGDLRAHFEGQQRRRGIVEIGDSHFPRGEARWGEAATSRTRGDAAPPKTPLAAALTDGEDFELLFTVASRDAVKLLDAWKKKFPKLKLSCIGKIVAAEGVTIRDKAGSHKLSAYGYEHFAT